MLTLPLRRIGFSVMESQEPAEVVLFNRGDRVMLDLSAVAEPPGEDEPEAIRKSHARLMAVHGSLGTVVRGDDNRNAFERFIHRRTGRPAATIRVAWDAQAGQAPRRRPRRKDRQYLSSVVYRSQLRHTDAPRSD